MLIKKIKMDFMDENVTYSHFGHYGINIHLVFTSFRRPQRLQLKLRFLIRPWHYTLQIV